MDRIDQRLYDRNLQTAWLLAGDWPLEHQERLAELVVDRFIRTPDEGESTATVFPRNSTYAGPGCGVAV